MQHTESPAMEHSPVMPVELLQLLDPKPGAIIVDATVGLGGHAELILERIAPEGILIGIDRDRSSLELARRRLISFGGAVRLMHENFKNLPLVMHNLATGPVDGIVADLGISAWQMLSCERGFSFQSDAMLDMRMDQSQRLTAADLVNTLPEAELAQIIFQFGEEPFARRIAAALVAARKQSPITRCNHLAEIVSRVTRVRGIGGIHPATRTFQALRIAINGELEGLDTFIEEALEFLKKEGRMVLISFHSLEDRIVKRTFRMLAGQCICERPPQLCTCPRKARARLLTPRALKVGGAELDSNPRARSARMRALERLQE